MALRVARVQGWGFRSFFRKHQAGFYTSIGQIVCVCVIIDIYTLRGAVCMHACLRTYLHAYMYKHIDRHAHIAYLPLLGSGPTS